MSTEITKAAGSALEYGLPVLPVGQIVRQAESVKELMKNAMQRDVHYGFIPGCGKKPTLLQPGAQKMMLMFALADTYEIIQTDYENGHREYRVTCKLLSKRDGTLQGSGEGLCTTMEKKYRYRNGSDYEITGEPIPADSKERKAEYRKMGLGMKKVDGTWEWVRYSDTVQQENPDIADTYNTVLKMACKRALVAAVLNSLAVSDAFTQDIEDQLVSYAEEYPHEHQHAYEAPVIEIVTDDEPEPELEHKEDLSEEQYYLGDLMRQAKEAGIKVSGIKQFAVAKFDKPIQSLNGDELDQVIQHVKGLIADAEELAGGKDLVQEDIPF